MRRATILLAVVAMLALVSVPAYGAVSSNAGTYNWFDLPTNWYDSSGPAPPPNGGVDTRIKNNATITLNSPTTVGRLTVGNLALANLIINADLTATNDSVFGFESGNSGTVLVTQNSGTFKPSYNFYLANRSHTNKYSYAKYTINGGSFILGANRSFRLGRDYGDVTGHSFGTFEVDGSGADSIFVGNYTHISGSTLSLIFDGDSDPVQQIDVDSNVTLDGTLTVTGSAPVGTYTVMQYGGTLTGVFSTEDLPSGWSVDYGSGSGDAITITVPEPATMVLLGIGACLPLLRKRR